MCPRSYLVSAAQTVFVIPAKAGIHFFGVDPCLRGVTLAISAFRNRNYLGAGSAFFGCQG